MNRISRVAAGLATTLAATCVIQAPHAYADPDNDFLTALNKYGIDLTAVMGVSISPQDSVELGRDICDDLHQGGSPAGEADALYRMMPKMTDKQAANLVSAAQFAYCPDTMAGLHEGHSR